MDDRALIRKQLAVGHRLLTLTLHDISDGEAKRSPSPPLSPIVWHAGHVAFSNFSFALGRQAAPARVPEGYPALFAMGTGGDADYPAFSAVVEVLDDSHAALLAAVAGADLDAANEGPFGAWSNLAEMFAFASNHCSYHVGKIATLRALLGKPRLIG